MEDNLTNASPYETAKIKTHHARIVVGGTAEKPYFSIEWYDPQKNECYLGYSSYCIGNVFEWLEECFEVVEASKTNADRIRAMSDKELAKFLWNIIGCTVADHIRAMSDKELAEFLCNIIGRTVWDGCSGCIAADYCYPGHTGMIDYLKEEYDGKTDI